MHKAVQSKATHPVAYQNKVLVKQRATRYQNKVLVTQRVSSCQNFVMQKLRYAQHSCARQRFGKAKPLHEVFAITFFVLQLVSVQRICAKLVYQKRAIGICALRTFGIDTYQYNSAFASH